MWISYFRGEDNPEADLLSEALERDEDVCISGIILTEVLQGIRHDAEYQTVRLALEKLILLPMPNKAYLLAADIYRQARLGGETVRNTIDCLIAACAITHHVWLVQRDKDFEVIARYSKLKLVRAGQQ